MNRTYFLFVLSWLLPPTHFLVQPLPTTTSENQLTKNPPEKKTCHHSLAKGKYPIIPLSLVNRVVFQPGYVYLNRIVSNHFFPYQVDCTSPMDETNHQDLGEVVEDAAGPTDWLVKMRLGKKNTTSEIHICLLKSYIIKRKLVKSATMRVDLIASFSDLGRYTKHHPKLSVKNDSRGECTQFLEH